MFVVYFNVYLGFQIKDGCMVHFTLITWEYTLFKQALRLCLPQYNLLVILLMFQLTNFGVNISFLSFEFSLFFCSFQSLSLALFLSFCLAFSLSLSCSQIMPATVQPVSDTTYVSTYQFWGNISFLSFFCLFFQSCSSSLYPSIPLSLSLFIPLSLSLSLYPSVCLFPLPIHTQVCNMQYWTTCKAIGK